MAASIREMADEASFIFEGTLRRTGAVTSSALQPAADMAVVHIGRILKGPPALASFSGHEVTVQLRQPGPAEHGRNFTFSTTGLHFGDGRAVREVGRIDTSGPEVEKEVHEAEHERQNELLLSRLRDAEIVVGAKRSAPLPIRRRTRRISRARNTIRTGGNASSGFETC